MKLAMSVTPTKFGGTAIGRSAEAQVGGECTSLKGQPRSDTWRWRMLVDASGTHHFLVLTKRHPGYHLRSRRVLAIGSCLVYDYTRFVIYDL